MKSGAWELKDGQDSTPVNPFEVGPGSIVMIPEECKAIKDAVAEGWDFYLVVNSTISLSDVALEVLGTRTAVNLLFSKPALSAPSPALSLQAGNIVYYKKVVEREQRPPLLSHVVAGGDTTAGALALLLLQDADAWHDIRLDQVADTRPTDANAVVANGRTVYIRLFQGDMHTTQEHYDTFAHDPESNVTVEAAAVDKDSRRWPAKQPIPYCLHTNLKSDDKSNVLAAIAHIKQNTCITFKEVACTSSRRVKFFIDPEAVQGGYCWSKMGMSSDGQNEIAAGCGMGTMVHEIGHTLGLQHEQARSDREKFINIIWKNIEEDWKDQYDAENTLNTLTPYDFGSIMHYSASNKMTAKTGAADTARMGNRKGLSRHDIVAYNYLVGYEGGCGGSTTPTPSSPSKPPTRAPAPTSGGTIGGGGTGKCAAQSTWPNYAGVKCDSSLGNCWGLVSPPKHGTCRAYCASFGHVCKDAAEDKANDCAVTRKYGCDADIKALQQTSDMLCKCVKKSADAEALESPEEQQCSRGATWPDVIKECGRSCTVLVDQFSSKYNGKCADYCKSVGKVCTAAWEELADTCSSLLTLDCNTAPNFKTNDAICECSNSPEGATSGASAAAASALLLPALVALALQ